MNPGLCLRCVRPHAARREAARTAHHRHCLVAVRVGRGHGASTRILSGSCANRTENPHKIMRTSVYYRFRDAFARRRRGQPPAPCRRCVLSPAAAESEGTPAPLRSAQGPETNRFRLRTERRGPPPGPAAGPVRGAPCHTPAAAVHAESARRRGSETPPPASSRRPAAGGRRPAAGGAVGAEPRLTAADGSRD